MTQPEAAGGQGSPLLLSLFPMRLNWSCFLFICLFAYLFIFSSAGTLSERSGTTDIPIDLLQITSHFLLQDSEMTFWKMVTLSSHCHWLWAKSASRWGSARAMVIMGRMVVRALLLKSTTCSRRSTLGPVCE